MIHVQRHLLGKVLRDGTRTMGPATFNEFSGMAKGPFKFRER